MQHIKAYNKTIKNNLYWYRHLSRWRKTPSTLTWLRL